MELLWAFLAGLVVGGTVGIVVAALLLATREETQRYR